MTASSQQFPGLIGMLYIVSVRMTDIASGDLVRHQLVVVGNAQEDVERKLQWVFDADHFSGLSIVDIEKVREKVHVLKTTVQKVSEPENGVIERKEGSQPIPSMPREIEKYDPKLFAVGVATTILARDSDHALRKVGNAIVASCSAYGARVHTGASLSSDSTVSIQEIPKSSGYAKPRDVSRESNRAHMVRG